MSNVIEQIQELKAIIKEHHNADNATSMKAYMLEKFDFEGMKAPQRTEVQKRWFPTLDKNINHWDFVLELWEQPYREYQYIAVDLLKRVSQKKMHEKDHVSLERIITDKPWWDTVDLIASNYVGKYFQQFPEMRDSVIERWRKSENIWLNRTCLLFQLKYKENTDFELLKALILEFKPNQEFFIQKAIGWSLRQHSKYAPDEVRDFIESIELSSLAQKEASKYL